MVPAPGRLRRMDRVSDENSPRRRPGRAPAAPDLLVFTRQSVREVDRAAIEEFGVPGVVLMENAALALFERCMDELETSDEPGPVIICCGGGNNGGDGLALARHLHNAGADAVVLIAATIDGFAGDALVNLRIAQRMGLPIAVLDPESPVSTLAALLDSHGEPGMVVDALLGTGLDRPLSHPITEVVGWINDRAAVGAIVIAADIPTGLDCDTGAPLLAPGDTDEEALRRAVVVAHATVTFVGVKAGFLAPGAERWTGEVCVGDIGAPIELLQRYGVPAQEH
ncbi:MAG: NAD(P)H-hydrate epimerase [Phycisphaerales bacterium]|nr:MAG: NAD(P)H-hydrate epimerase [Phycisphaerales bacterium]